MAFRPNVLFLVNQPIEELIRRFRRLFAVFLDLSFCAMFRNRSEVANDGHVDTRFFPGFARRGFDFAFVGFPAAFWKDPAFARG